MLKTDSKSKISYKILFFFINLWLKAIFFLPTVVWEKYMLPFI